MNGTSMQPGRAAGRPGPTRVPAKGRPLFLADEVIQ